MRSKPVFIIAGIGLTLALVSAFLAGRRSPVLPPAYAPAANPYAKGLYANGIVESAQAQGENINLYPEIAGPVTQVMVSEGAAVHRGDVLLTIDDSVQRATAQQLQAQAAAAAALLEELKAEPRPETLAVAAAQVDQASAALKNTADQLAKQEQAYGLDAKAVSLDSLDNARNARRVAAANLEVAQKQFALTRAGAWRYDIQNQERQVAALTEAHAAAAALLAKYAIRAPVDGIVRAIQAAPGSYVSPQGAYDSYTQGTNPLIVMGTPDDTLQVRVYVDEILIHRLADPSTLKAEMFIRGTDVHVPLSFSRIQPLVSPKIELSNARQERVDLRVLPVIFRFKNSKDLRLYAGQLVDVYVDGN